MKRFWKRLRKRRRLDRDLQEELAFHLAMKAEEAGNGTEVHSSFGNTSVIRQACRDLWAFTWIEGCWRDFRYALRTLSQSPLVTAIAIIALTLGIGMNTVVFTIVSRALAFDLGVDHLENIMSVDVSRNANLPPLRLGLDELRSQVKSFEFLAGYLYMPANVSDGAALPDRYNCIHLSSDGFSIMNRQPILGRRIQAEDERSGAPPIVLLTHHLWEDRYGKDLSIVGKTIRVDELPHTVIGVMPPGLRFPEDGDLWVPYSQNERLHSEAPAIFGRLAPGVQIGAARSEIDGMARRLAAQYPDRFKGLIADVQPILQMYGVYGLRPIFLAMFVAVGFVLLIACSNVANLLLSRAAVRSREISIRIAIGAGRGRIIRQLLVESIVLSIAGGFGGWLLALGGLHWFDRLTAAVGRPAWVDFSMDHRVFGYLAAISIGAGILFGLAPALQLAKVDVNNAVKDGGQGSAGPMRGRRLAGLLVAFEMVLCVVLLVGAGLLIRSSLKMYGAPLGFNPSSVLTMVVSLPEAKYPLPGDRIDFHRLLASHIESLPGVQSVALASNLPVTRSSQFSGELSEPRQSFEVRGLTVSPSYFRTLQIPTRMGRLFDKDKDTVVVNESFAAKFWPGENPLGRSLRLNSPGAPRSWLFVSSVVDDVMQSSRDLNRPPLIYLPYAAAPQASMFVVARTAVAPGSLAKAFRLEVQRLDPNLPAFQIQTLEDRVARSHLEIGMFGILFSVFAAVALVLGFAGLYAVTAHAVSRRTREIGVRIALGARTPDIFRLVLGQGLRPLVLGLAVGLPLAFAVTRVLRMALLGVTPGDPLTFVAVPIILLAAGILGSVLPARRASRVDPTQALRSE